MANEDYLKISKDRIGVLIGKNGETKRKIEKLAQVDLFINSEDATVTVSSRENMEDPLAVWKTANVVRAIGRGFNPNVSLKLLNDDIYLEIIKISDYVGKSKKAMLRQKGRIIGREGITRKIILDMTGVSLSVYGKTASIIGDLDQITIAREAIIMILNGSRHKTIYAFLEKKKQDLKMKEFQDLVGMKKEDLFYDYIDDEEDLE